MDDYENRRLRRRAGAAEEELDASKAKIKQQQHSIEDLYGENAALVAKVKEVRERATIHYQRSEQIRVLAARMMKERDAARARVTELEAVVLAACTMRDAIDYVAGDAEVAAFDAARAKIKIAHQPLRPAHAHHLGCPARTGGMCCCKDW